MLASGRLSVLFGALALLAATAYLFGSNFIPGNWSFTKDVRQYDGRFFRMVVKLDYLGEPQTFDFVVGCQVKATHYTDGSRSRDVGFIPAVYGRRMKDNKAVVIRPPDVCNGETTENGQVPPAFMPLIVVYDNADTLDMGLAYLSDDAYDSPVSDLKFHSTEIISSSRAEFDADGESGVPNIISREKFVTNQGVDVVKRMGPIAKPPRFADTCFYALRYRLPDRVRANARKYWPDEKPRFWYPLDYEQQQAIIGGVHNFDQNRNNPEYFVQSERDGQQFFITQMRKFEEPDVGAPRATGAYRIHPTKFSSTGSEEGPLLGHYPVTSSVAERYWPKNPKDWPSYVSGLKDPAFKAIEVGGNRKRGFGACWTLPNVPYRVSPPDPVDEATWNKFVRIAGHTTVDNERVAAAPGELANLSSLKRFVFENDEFVLELMSFDFGVMGGDVR
jgi:hypothetical protein